MPGGEPVRMPIWGAGNSQEETAFLGFTLLELLVVIVLVGLLVSLVPPRLSGAFSSAQIRATVRELVATLRLARGQAIHQGQPVTCFLDLEQKRFGLRGRAKQHELPDNLRVRLTTARSTLKNDGSVGIRFMPDGTATGGEIVLQREDQRYVIHVDWITGRVRVR